MKISELKKILPKGFKNSKFEKNALSMNEGSIEMSFRLEQSPFWEINYESESIPKTVIIVGIGVYDRYSAVIERGHAIHIMDVSISHDNQMVNVTGYDKIKHWDNEDKQSITEVLLSELIPWLNWITSPKVLIDYLKCLESTVLNQSSESECGQFSSLLNSLDDYPINARKTFNGAIATLYEQLLDYENSVKHLNLHKEFLIADFPTSCKVQSMIEAFDRKMQIIDDGIKRLNYAINEPNFKNE